MPRAPGRRRARARSRRWSRTDRSQHDPPRCVGPAPGRSSAASRSPIRRQHRDRPAQAAPRRNPAVSAHDDQPNPDERCSMNPFDCALRAGQRAGVPPRHARSSGRDELRRRRGAPNRPPRVGATAPDDSPGRRWHPRAPRARRARRLRARSLRRERAALYVRRAWAWSTTWRRLEAVTSSVYCEQMRKYAPEVSRRCLTAVRLSCLLLGHCHPERQRGILHAILEG